MYIQADLRDEMNSMNAVFVMAHSKSPLCSWLIVVDSFPARMAHSEEGYSSVKITLNPSIKPKEVSYV